jgi:hypothetical protein
VRGDSNAGARAGVDHGVKVFGGVVLRTLGPQTLTGTDTGNATINGTSNAISVL